MKELLQNPEVQAAIWAAVAALAGIALKAVIPTAQRWAENRNENQKAILRECVDAAVEIVYQDHVRKDKAKLKKSKKRAAPELKTRWNDLAVETTRDIAEKRGLKLKKILGRGFRTILPSLVSAAVKTAKERF